MTSVLGSLSTVFLTFFGLASIGLSCLMALFLYHVVFGVRYLGILNGVAAFVIIGIGEGAVSLFPSLPNADNLENIFKSQKGKCHVIEKKHVMYHMSFYVPVVSQSLTFSLILFDVSMCSLCNENFEAFHRCDSPKMSHGATVKVAISKVCNASDCVESTAHSK